MIREQGMVSSSSTIDQKQIRPETEIEHGNQLFKHQMSYIQHQFSIKHNNVHESNRRTSIIQHMVMHETFQKWLVNILIEALKHVHNKSELSFHGNKVMNENRAKMQMVINLIFQISNNLLNQITRDKLHCNQHARLYIKHGMVYGKKIVENLLVF